ncbi:RDD family protein [Stenotrophomonas mori]|uniref:RDD family protein n=1 Tax=Stenotrophomonas mori TaxID=2871096 RepID=A0ABT0SJP7_9GAMM|nr:RDD family protein [Stenotrophomonas mori]MCL7715554.1 RDD family protein [Stenotrophomonas mori]
MSATADTPLRTPPLLLRRLLALFYDLWPVLALWMLTAVPFTLLDVALSGDARHNIAPYSPLQWLLWLGCWAVAGLYATLSWKRGGQTLGMRPWRLHVHGADGAASMGALWGRYAVGTLSLLCGGLGFWWALLDRQGLTLHDRLSGTRLVHRPRPPGVSSSGA